MKKIAILMMLAALLFAGCANDGDSGNDAGGNTGNTTGNSGNNSGSNSTGNDNGDTNTNTEYTLSFDKNFPYENIKSPNYSSYKYTAKSPQFTENGNKYFYELESSTDSEQPSKKGSTIELEKSPYAYYKCIVLGEEVDDFTPNRRTKTYDFDHYNTKADDSGTSYKTGDKITLTSDTTLYCFYAASAENTALDFSVTRQYSMKVGETVEIARYFNDIYEIYISNSDEISPYLEHTGNSTSGNSIYKAKSVGTVTVRAKDWDDNSRSWYCYITITADGFSGNSIEYQLLGTWKYTDSSSNGTITLNADKTGHIKVTLQGSTVHDNSFTWSAYESKSGSTTYQYLSISGTGISSLDGSHRITNIRTNRFTLNDYLAFGMPQQTTWNKQ